MTDHDDELGAFLRSEVPEPAADYWDRIDAMLDGVASERAHDPAPEAGGRHLRIAPAVSEMTDAAEIPADEMQIGDDVVRLTDLTQTTPTSSPTHRNLLLAAAAAIAVIVGIGAYIATLGNDPETSIEAAENGDATTNASTVDDADNGQGGENNSNQTDTDIPGSSVRRCYSNGEVTLTLDVAQDGQFTGFQVPIGFAAEAGNLTGFDLAIAPGGGSLRTIAGVPISSDVGSHRVSEAQVAGRDAGLYTVSTSEWTVTDTLVSQPGQVEPIEFTSADCADTTDDLAPVEADLALYPDAPSTPVTITEIATTPGQNRICYSFGGGDVIVFDFTDDGASANALPTNSMETISATRLAGTESTYSVATLVLGDRENGLDTIRVAEWTITPERINLPIDGEEIPAVDCAAVADEVAQAENFLGAAPYPAYPQDS